MNACSGSGFVQYSSSHSVGRSMSKLCHRRRPPAVRYAKARQRCSQVRKKHLERTLTLRPGSHKAARVRSWWPGQVQRAPCTPDSKRVAKNTRPGPDAGNVPKRTPPQLLLDRGRRTVDLLPMRADILGHTDADADDRPARLRRRRTLQEPRRQLHARTHAPSPRQSRPRAHSHKNPRTMRKSRTGEQRHENAGTIEQEITSDLDAPRISGGRIAVGARAATCAPSAPAGTTTTRPTAGSCCRPGARAGRP